MTNTRPGTSSCIARHTHYARYAPYYLCSMEEMPSEVFKYFMNGEHTVQHRTGLFTGIWTDMAIETTFMRFEKGRSGIITQTGYSQDLGIATLCMPAMVS